MGLRIRMFGEFAVWRDNALIEDWGSEQTKALLKILLGERGRIFRCEQLAEYLWPEHSDYTQALRFLRAYVHQLRRVLEPGTRAPSLYIQTLRDSYRFSAEAECTIDVEEFAAHSQWAKELMGQKKYSEAASEYEQAISRYAGDYLAEDRYEEWAIAERDRWRHQYVSALLGLTECETRQGHYRRAVELCRQAWTADKYREDIYRQAMLCNYLMGNQAEALRLYQECERVLSGELGVKPSEPTRHLYEQIREGHIVELDRAYPTPELVPYPVHHSLSRLPFVGRREEYRRLLRRLEEASEGSGGLVLIGGEVGAGKTRLAQEIIRYAQTRFKTRALQGRCTELGAKQPYQALLHALRDYLLALDQQAREQLPALSLDVLAPWLPDLGLPRRSALSLPPLRPDQERLRFFAAIRQLLLQLSETHPPLLLFLDDLQWTDPSTVDFLDYLFSQIAEHPLLILGTYRSEELQKDHSLMPLTRRVLRERVGQGTDDLQLSQLSEQEIDELLRGVSPALKDRERLSRYLHRESGGNPLFLVAILQSLFEARVITTTAAGDWAAEVAVITRRYRQLQPREIQEILRPRIERLSQENKQILELMSVIGHRCELAWLKHLWRRLNPSGANPLELVQRLESLEQTQIISGVETHYSFAHDKIRDVLYHQITSAQRRLLHGYAVEALKEFYRDRLESVHGLLAYHYAQAGLPQQALEHLLPALRDAVAGYRNDEGLELSDEAWALTEQLATHRAEPRVVQLAQFEILTEKIKVHDILGHRIEQEATLIELLELTDQLADEPKRAQAHLMRAKLYLDTSRYPLAETESLKALKIAMAQKDLMTQSHALHSIVLIHYRTGAYSEARAYLGQEQELQKTLGDAKSLAETSHYLGLLSLRSGQYEEAEKHYGEALKLLDSIKDRQGRADTLSAMGAMYWAQGEYRQAIATYEEVRRLAAEIGDRRAEAHALSSLGMAWWSSGAYEIAQKYLQEAAGIHREIGDKRTYGLDMNNLGLVYWSLGANQAAHQCFENTYKLSQEIGWKEGEAFTLANLGLLHWRTKELNKAVDLIQQAVKIHRTNRSQRDLGIVLRNLGEIYCDAGKYPQALEHLEQALVISRALGSKLEEMQVLSDQSATYLRMKNKAKALDCSQSAIDFLKKIKRFPHAQQVLYFHYRTLTAAGQEQAARKFLHRAYKALMRRAKRITNPEFRQSFLKNISIHREIAETYARHFQRFNLSETECYELLRRVRWAKGVACPYCNGRKIRVHGQVNRTSEKRYVCMSCHKTFNDRTETVFAHKNISLAKLFQALLRITHALEGASTTQALSKELKIQLKTVAKLHHELSAALKEDALVQRLAERLRKSSSD